MTVTAQLLRVYEVDKMMRGLKSRLNASESFLNTQVKELATLDAERKGIEATLKQQTAQAADQEGEVKRLEARLAHLREQMNNAQTNKEYQTFLVELNTFKTEKDRIEVGAIEVLGKVEETRAKLAALDVKRAEREQVREVAAREREERFREIEGRLNELSTDRASFVEQVPKDTMVMFQRLIDVRGDEAMGSIEIIDRKRDEYSCNACMMTVPIESISGLLSNGKLTRCTSCQCVLYLRREDEDRLKGVKKEPKQSAKSRGGQGL